MDHFETDITGRDYIPDQPEEKLPAVEGPRFSPTLYFLSWMLIVLAVGSLVVGVAANQFFSQPSYQMSAGELIGVNLTARMMIGYGADRETALETVGQFSGGPLQQRYSHAILVNEFAGPAEALKRLKKIDTAIAKQVAKQPEDPDGGNAFPLESHRRIRDVLGRLFENYEREKFDSSVLPNEDRELLVRELGWVGELALTPDGSPDRDARNELESDGLRTVAILVVALLGGLLILVGAFIAIAVFAGLFFGGNIKSLFHRDSGHGFVYLETFAIWLVLFLGLQFGIQIMSRFVDFDGVVSLALVPLIFFGSLSALVWPGIRGVAWRQVRQDIGWERFNPLAEFFVGGLSYLALVIPMIVGIAATAVLAIALSLTQQVGEFEAAGSAGHPIADELASGNPMIWIFAIVSAAIAAPIVEETMFRGVLYRYLRDATGAQPRWISVACSALVAGLIFAMIHPQGVIGIPALTTLAIGFTLVREWRNSLVAPMIMHAIHNGLLTGFTLLLLV